MSLSHAIARWFRRCIAWVTASDRDLIESDLHDLELTMRGRRGGTRRRVKRD
jgi:hypothetical protein